MSDNFEVKNSIAAHKNNVHNLNEKHQNELEKIKNQHSKRKAQLANQHAQALFSARTNNQKELIQQAKRHEDTLNRMREGLQEVQERSHKKKEAVSQRLERELANEKELFRQRTEREKFTRKMVLEEMNQEANHELKRLQTEIEQKESELRRNARLEKDMLESKSKNELSMNKQTYHMKKNASQDKYQSALRKQQRSQADIMASEEKKFQKRLENRTGNYQKELKKIKSDGDHKKTMAKTMFEKRFKEQIAKQEKQLGELMAKKEQIIQRLRNQIIDAHKLDAQKSDDPFYTATSLNPSIEEKDGAYLISLEVPESEAGNIFINGHKRKLTLSMNRRYENTNDADGAVEKVKKVETLTRSFNVEKIIDPTKVEKSYSDGALTFRVKHA